MRALIREAAAIVGLATIVGLAYNVFNPNGLPLIRHHQRLPVVDDSVLLRELGQGSAQPAAPAEAIPAPGNAPVQERAPAERRHVLSAPAAQQRTPAEAAPHHPSPQESPIRAVRYEQVLQLLEHPELLLIDARRPEDYAAGHIPGARNIFAYDFAAHIPELIALPRTKPILIYCDGGQCELSHYLAEQLRNLGFQRLYIYEGGWEEWRRRHSQ